MPAGARQAGRPKPLLKLQGALAFCSFPFPFPCCHTGCLACCQTTTSSSLFQKFTVLVFYRRHGFINPGKFDLRRLQVNLDPIYRCADAARDVQVVLAFDQVLGRVDKQYVVWLTAFFRRQDTDRSTRAMKKVGRQADHCVDVAALEPPGTNMLIGTIWPDGFLFLTWWLSSKGARWHSSRMKTMHLPCSSLSCSWSVSASLFCAAGQCSRFSVRSEHTAPYRQGSARRSGSDCCRCWCTACQRLQRCFCTSPWC